MLQRACVCWFFSRQSPPQCRVFLVAVRAVETRIGYPRTSSGRCPKCFAVCERGAMIVVRKMPTAPVQMQWGAANNFVTHHLRNLLDLRVCRCVTPQPKKRLPRGLLGSYYSVDPLPRPDDSVRVLLVEPASSHRPCRRNGRVSRLQPHLTRQPSPHASQFLTGLHPRLITAPELGNKRIPQNLANQYPRRHSPVAACVAAPPPMRQSFWPDDQRHANLHRGDSLPDWVHGVRQNFTMVAAHFSPPSPCRFDQFRQRNSESAA